MALTKVNRGGLNTGVTDSSNATFLTVDNSEQAVIKSECGSNTTSVQQGLLKHFVTIQGTDTFSTIDSFNQSSATDHGTGDHSSTYTTNMDEARVPRVVYTHNTADEGSSFYANAIRAGTHSSGKGTVAPTTSAFRFDVYHGSDKDVNGAVVDLSYLYMMTSGGLS